MKKAKKHSKPSGSFGSGPSRGVTLRLPKVSYLSVAVVVIASAGIFGLALSATSYFKQQIAAIYTGNDPAPSKQQIVQDQLVVENSDVAPGKAPVPVEDVSDVPLQPAENTDAPDDVYVEEVLPVADDQLAQQAALASVNEQTEDQEEKLY